MCHGAVVPTHPTGTVHPSHPGSSFFSGHENVLIVYSYLSKVNRLLGSAGCTYKGHVTINGVPTQLDDFLEMMRGNKATWSVCHKFIAKQGVKHHATAAVSRYG